jgi:hypothetical protein
MGKETLILKRAVECASSRMPMNTSGKGLVGIFRLSCSTRLNEAQALNFFGKGGVTYVTGKEVTKQLVFDGLCSVNAKFILRV